MTTYSSFEDATYEDLALAQAEEQHRERDEDAEMEDRFIAAQPPTSEELALEDLPF